MTIRKTKKGYVLYSSKGRRLSKPTTLAKAKKREKQVRFFKNNAKYRRDHGRSIPMRRRRRK